MPSPWRHGHQNGIKIGLIHSMSHHNGRPVGSGAGNAPGAGVAVVAGEATGAGAVCGFGKQPSGAVIAGVAGSGGVAVKPSSSG